MASENYYYYFFFSYNYIFGRYFELTTCDDGGGGGDDALLYSYNIRFTGMPAGAPLWRPMDSKEQVVVVGQTVRQAARRAYAQREERNGTSPASTGEEQFHRRTAVFRHFSRRISRNFLIDTDFWSYRVRFFRKSRENPSKIFRRPVPAASFAPILRRRRRTNTVTSVFFMAVRPSASFERTVG